MLERAVDERYTELAEHGARVASSAARVGEALDLDADAADRLWLAAKLHDVGKVATPPGILEKAGPLTKAEWAHVLRHPEAGAQFLVSSNLDSIAHIVVAHHERPDGRGYPYGVAGADIPLEALIIAAADAYDAMVSERPYRAALSHREAVEELRAGSGSQFDPGVVDALMAVLSSTSSACC